MVQKPATKTQSFDFAKKPIIGMLHLDYLAGQKEYRGPEYLASRALTDIHNLQDGGINGILIENWRECTTAPEADKQNVICMLNLCKHLREQNSIRVPFGVNVLNNDFKMAFKIAEKVNASFVQLDVFVDHVRTAYDFNESTKQNPFEIKVDPELVISYKPAGVDLFVFIQPKHYLMLEKNKTIENSARQAYEYGASAIIVTGLKTGEEPNLELIRRAKAVVPASFPVGIGSGFSAANAYVFLPHVDFVIVGTALKYENNVDNPVDMNRVKKIMDIKRAVVRE